MTATGFVETNGVAPSDIGGAFLGLGSNPVLLQIAALAHQLIPYSCTKSFVVLTPGPLTIRLFGFNTYPSNPVGIASSTINALYVPNGY